MLIITQDNFFLLHSYVIMDLYILEQPSSWSTSGICPSLPQSRVELRLLILYFTSILLVCLQYPAVYSNDSSFPLNPSSLAGRLNTNVQVNNTATSHHMCTSTHIYMTFILLFILSFILLPFSWAGWLAQTLSV